jgi:hypothetical protein
MEKLDLLKLLQKWGEREEKKENDTVANLNSDIL